MKTSSKPICAVLLTYWGECAAFSGGSFESDDTLDTGILVRVSPECGHAVRVSQRGQCIALPCLTMEGQGGLSRWIRQ